MLTAALLDRIWPRCNHSLIDGIVAAAPTVLPKYGITTPLVAVHLGAHCSVECAAGTAPEENLHYSAERAHEVWPSRFPTLASAAPYARSPRLLADKVYGGRDEYERVGKECGLDLVGNPDLVCAPSTCLEVAAAFFRMCGAIPHAEKDDIVGETKLINGGLNGLAEREAWLHRLKREFGL